MEGTVSATDPVSPPALPEMAAGNRPLAGDVRGVLSHLPFRRLWIALSFSSLGDWLGFLATTALAAELTGDDQAKSAYAISGVFFFRLLPALVIGPFAGAFADRFDRRKLMVVCDLSRFVVFASIPLVRNLAYLLVASFLVEAISLFWISAKEASVPNLVPEEKLEAANQLGLITAYGTAPVAAAVFIALAVIARLLGAANLPFFDTNRVDLALYVNAATFLFTAWIVWQMHDSIGHAKRAVAVDDDDTVEKQSLFKSIGEGWRFVGQSPLMRGLVFGILGAFAAGGVVIALAKPFVVVLHGGNAGYGLLFGAVFTGLALGMAAGPQLLADFSRKSLFGLSIMAAGVTLMINAVLPNLIFVITATLLVGAFAGIAWVTGYTMLGAEVADELRGRTFAFVQSLVRVDMLVVLVAAPLVAGRIGFSEIRIGHAEIRSDGVTLTLFAAGAIAALVGLLAFREMDEHAAAPLLQQIRRALRPDSSAQMPHYPGLFIAFEGGEGAGKSTQVELLAQWLEDAGLRTVITREPGGTALGREVRRVLLDRATTGLSPRAEALLYAMDRAQHVAEVMRPALHRGDVVITDRYVDSTLAYQGGGRELSQGELSRLSKFATGNLVADLTVLLDIDPRVGLSRITDEPDRMEAEEIGFHDRVREAFTELAGRAPHRYLVVDASKAPADVQQQIRSRVARLIPSDAMNRVEPAPVAAVSEPVGRA
ncbi:MAG: dTMP kinase [Mycobacteriales bacterium]